MNFHNWNIGLHIQSTHLNAVAMRLQSDGWQLYRCWRLPWHSRDYNPAPALIQALTGWRTSLPARHHVRMAFSASRTVQRRLANPGTLRETDCERYVASSTAQQMQMQASALCWDYQPADNQRLPSPPVDYPASAPQAAAYPPVNSPSANISSLTISSLNNPPLNNNTLLAGNSLQVTAAHEKDLDLFRDCARALRLTLTAVTPDASALGSFFPWLSEHIQAICYYDTPHPYRPLPTHTDAPHQGHWLWASRQQWGVIRDIAANALSALANQLALQPWQLAVCGDTPTDLPADIMRFDPWQTLSAGESPPSDNRGDFAIALGLAIGQYPPQTHW